jgi:hypothetical protein
MLSVRPMVYFHENFLKPNTYHRGIYSVRYIYRFHRGDSYPGRSYASPAPVTLRRASHRPRRRSCTRAPARPECIPSRTQPRLCEVRKGIRSSNSALRFRLKSSPSPFLFRARTLERGFVAQVLRLIGRSLLRRIWHLPRGLTISLAGCRGFTGPVPPPLSMSATGPRLVAARPVAARPWRVWLEITSRPAGECNARRPESPAGSAQRTWPRP